MWTTRFWRKISLVNSRAFFEQLWSNYYLHLWRLIRILNTKCKLLPYLGWRLKVNLLQNETVPFLDILTLQSFELEAFIETNIHFFQIAAFEIKTRDRSRIVSVKQQTDFEIHQGSRDDGAWSKRRNASLIKKLGSIIQSLGRRFRLKYNWFLLPTACITRGDERKAYFEIDQLDTQPYRDTFKFNTFKLVFPNWTS